MDLNGEAMTEIIESEIRENEARWKYALAGYVMGAKPYFAHLLFFAIHSWNPSVAKLFSRENEYFFFKFGCEADCARVLVGGPWLFDWRMIILKRWRSNITLDYDLSICPCIGPSQC